MMLITKEIAKKLPKLYANDKKKSEDIKVPLKLFTPWARWTWNISEYDPETGIMFGYVKSGLDPNFDELGYSDLNELKELKGPWGLKVERDRHWDGNTTLKKVMDSKSVL